MKKITLGLLILFMTSLVVFSGDQDVAKEKTAIQQVIESAYRDGIGNVGDAAAVEKGFYPGFNLLGMSPDGTEMWKYPIYQWINSVKKKKAAGKYPPKEKITFKFPFIDVTGSAAVVKVEFFKGEKHAYTDYLSLYKFSDGWRIVAKIYFEHKDHDKK